MNNEQWPHIANRFPIYLFISQIIFIRFQSKTNHITAYDMRSIVHTYIVCGFIYFVHDLCVHFVNLFSHRFFSIYSDAFFSSNEIQFRIIRMRLLMWSSFLWLNFEDKLEIHSQINCSNDFQQSPGFLFNVRSICFTQFHFCSWNSRIDHILKAYGFNEKSSNASEKRGLNHVKTRIPKGNQNPPFCY